MSASDLWFGTSGPHDAEIVIVGESWGAEEAAAKQPFVGTSGNELDRMLAVAGIDRRQCLVTNVVPQRPQSNEMWRFFHPKTTPSGHPIHGLDPHGNVRAGLTALYTQLEAFPRKLIIAPGNYALWALAPSCISTSVLRESNRRKVDKELAPLVPSGIGSWRGSMWFTETLPTRTPLLPIYHPAAIMRQWSWRDVTIHDLKRHKQALTNDWRPNPEPIFWAPPTFDQCVSRLRLWLARMDAGEELWLAEDIETARELITCLGIGDGTNFAMAIPFVRKRDDNSFDSWWTPDQEAAIIHLLRRVNRHPNVRIVGQNFVYDTQYIQRDHGVTPRLSFDTTLAQNVLFPGTPKALDYIASLYCRHYWYWKEDHKEWNLSGTIEDLLLYNCMDIVRTWETAAAQRSLLAHLKLEPQMAIKMRVNDLCLRMMNRGVRYDTARRAQLTSELAHAAAGIAEELEYIIPQALVKPGHDVKWPRSPTQTKEVFEMLGFDSVRNRKTDRPTSGKEARNVLKQKYPAWAPLFERLAVAESLDNTLGVLRSKLDLDQRLRCSYNPAGTETHRLSSSKNAFGRGTNLQNLTTGNEDA